VYRRKGKGNQTKEQYKYPNRNRKKKKEKRKKKNNREMERYTDVERMESVTDEAHLGLHILCGMTPEGITTSTRVNQTTWSQNNDVYQLILRHLELEGQYEGLVGHRSVSREKAVEVDKLTETLKDSFRDIVRSAKSSKELTKVLESEAIDGDQKWSKSAQDVAVYLSFISERVDGIVQRKIQSDDAAARSGIHKLAKERDDVQRRDFSLRDTFMKEQGERERREKLQGIQIKKLESEVEAIDLLITGNREKLALESSSQLRDLEDDHSKNMSALKQEFE